MLHTATRAEPALSAQGLYPARADAAVVSAAPVPSGLWRTLSHGLPRMKAPKGLDALWDHVSGKLVPLKPRRWLCLRRAQHICAMDRTVSAMSQEALRDEALALRAAFRLGRAGAAQVDRAFALVREVAHRTLGLKPHLVQVAAAVAMDTGCIVELATGEGKTLAATMPATLAGWRGRGCHIITVNDYLAQRDAVNMSPIYNFCGLRAAHVAEQMPPDERRAAYLADITYCTNKHVAADFLRDRLMLGQREDVASVLLAKCIEGHGPDDRMVMRGLECAIVDEADSVLIDEAVTPLIIAGEAPNEAMAALFRQAAELARHMQHGQDYTINHRYREVRMTGRGNAKLATLTAELGGVWKGARRSEELVSQAVTARDLYQPGRQYIIDDGKVVIVDEFTGRAMPDRSWQSGLHQAVEAKESLEITPVKQTLARISFQKFFRLYRRLSGMTGTAAEARLEMWLIYRRPVVRIPTHRPCIRQQRPDRIFSDGAARWTAILNDIEHEHARGRPVLIGTRSVAASEHLSELLTQRGLAHQVLNAVRHAEEARIIAHAGEAGRITVATNMAGRGTDIKLGPGVAHAGGLHVIASECHESTRIDRQLFGRAGRQGDPGSAALFVGLDDEILQRYAGRLSRNLLGRLRLRGGGDITSPWTRALLWAVRRRAGRLALNQRKGVLRTDDWLEEYLSFAGAQV